MKRFSPCKGCEKRYPGCHTECKAYIEYAEDNEKIKAERRKASLSRQDKINSIIRNQDAERRRKRRK